MVTGTGTGIKFMVVTITLNPIVERRFYLHNVVPGSANRAKKEALRAGGKGINVSRQIALFGIANVAVTFIGGDSGKLLRRALKEDEINFTPIQLKDEIRTGFVSVDETSKSVTSFFPPNPIVTKNEATDFLDKAMKVINNASVVVLAGSSPSPECDYIFPEIIRRANELDKTVILDTYGDHLENCLNASPTMLHINKSEIEKSLYVTLNDEDSYREILQSFYKKGIKLSFITNGSNSFYASKFDFHYRVDVPVVDEFDATGSGDAFVAGLVIGLEKALVFDEFVNLSVSLGALNAKSEKTCAVTPAELELANYEIRINAVGKKMKIIDDSPTI